jgi:hypothetical protein
MISICNTFQPVHGKNRSPDNGEDLYYVGLSFVFRTRLIPAKKKMAPKMLKSKISFMLLVP